jgi:hypothetical protein
MKYEEVMKKLYEFEIEYGNEPRKITVNYDTYMKLRAEDRHGRFNYHNSRKETYLGIDIECIPNQEEDIIIQSGDIEVKQQ